MKNEYSHDQECRIRTSTKVSGLLLILVQSSVTIVFILLLLLLKAVRLDAFNTIADDFVKAMTEDALITNTSSDNSAEVLTVSVPTVLSDVEILSVNSMIHETDGEDVYYPPLENGIVTSKFGERIDPFDSSKTVMHSGVDIAAEEGVRLYALSSGIVQEVGYEENGYGHYVLVRCDDDIHAFLYAHCNEILVREGDHINSGDEVAILGNTGRSTGSHVHIEWRENMIAIDPMTVLPEGMYV